MHKNVFSKQKQQKNYILNKLPCFRVQIAFIKSDFKVIFLEFWSATLPVSAFPLGNRNPPLTNAPNSLHVFD